MRIVNVAAATMVMLGAPIAPSAGHSIQAVPMRMLQVVPIKPKALVCKTPDPGWVAWYPGQVAPYILIGSTVTGSLMYTPPPGLVVLVRVMDYGSGGIVRATRTVPLSEWCH